MKLIQFVLWWLIGRTAAISLCPIGCECWNYNVHCNLAVNITLSGKVWQQISIRNSILLEIECDNPGNLETLEVIGTKPHHLVCKLLQCGISHGITAISDILVGTLNILA